jgi:hypothetical protein
MVWKAGGSPFSPQRDASWDSRVYRVVAVNVVVACCRYVRARRPEATTTREVVIKDVEVYRYLIS